MIVCTFVYLPVLVHVLAVGPVLGAQGKSFVSGLLQHVLVKQEIWSLAKTTAWCAQYMGALKYFLTTPTATCPEICNGLLFRTSDQYQECAYRLQNLKFAVFTRSWDNRGYFKKFGSSWIRPRSLFSKIFNGLLFGWTLWMYLPNLKFVALPDPGIIESTPKIWAVPGYWIRPRSLFSQIFKVLLFAWTLWIHLPNLKFLALPVPEIINRVYSKKLDGLWIRPRSLFSQIFNGLLFAWTLWINLPNLKFVALPDVPILG